MSKCQILFNSKKNSFFFLLIILSTSLGCRKGENDPVFSIYTRKNRLCKDWNASLWKKKITNSNGNFNNITLEDGKLTREDGGPLTPTATSTHEAFVKFTFRKDGTVTFIFFDKTSEETSITETYEGNWGFLGKNKQLGYLNKEAILITYTSYKFDYVNGTEVNIGEQTYVGDHQQETWEISELRSKKLTIERYTSYKDDLGSTNTNEKYQFAR